MATAMVTSLSVFGRSGNENVLSHHVIIIYNTRRSIQVSRKVRRAGPVLSGVPQRLLFIPRLGASKLVPTALHGVACYLVAEAAASQETAEPVAERGEVEARKRAKAPSSGAIGGIIVADLCRGLRGGVRVDPFEAEFTLDESPGTWAELVAAFSPVAGEGAVV
jgi:hypothetical protein